MVFHNAPIKVWFTLIPIQTHTMAEFGPMVQLQSSEGPYQQLQIQLVAQRIDTVGFKKLVM